MGSQAEDDRFLKHIAKVITDKRTAKSWTKAKLSRKTYLSRPLIVSYEKAERNIPILSLKYIADALDFPMTDYFIGLYPHDDTTETKSNGKDIRNLSIWKKEKTQSAPSSITNNRISSKFVRRNRKRLINPLNDVRRKPHNPLHRLLNKRGRNFFINRKESSR